MEAITAQRRASIETNTRLLRARERNLQMLAQSARCSKRSEAEAELRKVRAELASAYERLRHDQPDGSAGPRYPRG